MWEPDATPADQTPSAVTNCRKHCQTAPTISTAKAPSTPLSVPEHAEAEFWDASHHPGTLEVNRVLYVRNLPYKITNEELYDIFGKYAAGRIRIRWFELGLHITWGDG